MDELEPAVDDIEQVAEPLRGWYAQQGDKWVLRVARRNGWALEDVGSLKRAYEATKEEKRKLSERLASGQAKAEAMDQILAEFGEDIDLDDLRERIRGAASNPTAEGAPNPNVDEAAKRRAEEIIRQREKSLHKKFRGEKEELESKLKSAEERIASQHRYFHNSQIKGAMMDAKVRLRQAVEDHLMARTRAVADDNGQMRVQVLDEYGAPLTTATGDAVSLADYLESLKKDPDWGVLFEGSSHSGSGARPSESASRKGAYSDADIAAMSQQEYEKARSEGRI